jgi:signal peptidase
VTSQLGTVPAPRATVHPLGQLGLTVAALGELGALLDPFRPLVASVLERRHAGRVLGPAGEGTGRRAHPRTPNPHPVEGAISAREHQADLIAQPLSQRFLASLRRPVNIAFLVVLTVVLTAWWVELRPTVFLGGSATFITVKGTSMLPLLKTGDFVLAEAQPAYQVGDLVVYRMPKGQIGAGDDLIHRIVGGNAATGYTLKGDNNPSPDPWIVPRSDIVGKEALVIPGAGNTLLVLRSPLFAGLAAALVAMWMVLWPPEWMRRRKPAAEPAASAPAAAEPSSPTPAESAIALTARTPARRRSPAAAEPSSPTPAESAIALTARTPARRRAPAAAEPSSPTPAESATTPTAHTPSRRRAPAAPRKGR